jgi:hypothetical protein
VRWSPRAYTETLHGSRRTRRRRLPVPKDRRPTAVRIAWPVLALAGLLAVLLAATNLTAYFGLHEPDSFTRQASLTLFQPAPLRYDLWYQADLHHLSGLASTLSPPRRAVRLRAEQAALDRELAALDRTGPYRDRRGFAVYGPAVTGKLHALALARLNRQNLLTGVSPERLPGPETVFSFGGYRLYRTLPHKFASQDEVIRALDGLRLPDAALTGYRVYLLPGSLGDMSGLGGPGYSMLSGEPLTERLVDHQFASTATHEFGHHLSLSRLGGHLSDAPRQWSRFLALRHIPGWQDDGGVNTDAWARSPEEALAEDVRVLFGTPEAASLPYAAGYGDPRRDPQLRRAEESFLRSLAAQKASHLPDRSPAPWLDDLGAGLPADGPSPSPLAAWLALDGRRAFGLFLLLTAALGLAVIGRSIHSARHSARHTARHPLPPATPDQSRIF